MGRGQRHSKNAGVMGAESLSYAEKRALGFGTVRERLGKEAIGNWDDCCLTLQPVVDPVATPDGYLYTREAIVENLLQQKKFAKKRLAAWEAAHAREHDKATELSAVERDARLLAFDRQNHMGASARLTDSLQQDFKAEAEHLMSAKHVVSSAVTIHQNMERQREMKAFWMPSKTPEAEASQGQAPDMHTACPASGKRLRLKDLVPVKFTCVPEGDTGRYMDPITKDTFTNKSRLVLLKPTGDVMLHETYQTCVKPEGQYNGVRVKEKDVIELQRGGTGFAAHDGKKAQAQKHWHLGQGSGLADIRGQSATMPSKGGLAFWN